MRSNNEQEALDQLVNAVLGSAKYRHICPDLVRNIGAQELTRRRNQKEALKQTKNKLHQVSGAYGLERPERYAQWLAELKKAVATNNRADLQSLCQQIMQGHASTKERLPILNEFYSTLLGELPPITSVLDIACGLNPLSLPWMPQLASSTYYACDIHQPMLDFLQQYFNILSIKGEARACDVLQQCPATQVDLALVLKTIPCLEQVDKHAGKRLLETLQARYIIVSFPIYSLGGKSKGMSEFYAAHFRELVGEKYI